MAGAVLVRMDDCRTFCDDLETRLVVFESELASVRGKQPGATRAGREQMARLLARWPEAILLAHRRIAQLQQAGSEWPELRAGTEKLWGELKALIADADAAF